MKVKISKGQWESVGQAKGWISKEAQQQPAAATAQPALVPFQTALAQHPDLAKAFESVRVGIPFLKKLLAQYNVDWQKDPSALEILG